MSKLPFVPKNLYSRWPCEYKWSTQPKINLFFRIIIRTSNVKCKNLSKIYFESIKLHFSSLFQLRLMTKISRLQQIALGYLLISMADSVLTALFKDRSTRILKFKSQLTFAIFAAVNHLSGSTCSKLKCVFPNLSFSVDHVDIPLSLICWFITLLHLIQVSPGWRNVEFFRGKL